MANNDISKADVQKENFKLALGVFWRTAVAAFLCLFLYMSVTVLVTGMTTQTIGYRVVEKTEDSSAVIVKEINSVPSDEELKKMQEDLEENQVLQPISSEIPTGAAVAMDVVSQTLMLLLFIAFPYAVLWSKGDRDKNTVNFGHMEEDKLRGLKVGLMATLPAAVAYLALLVCKLLNTGGWYYAIYRFLNLPFMPIFNRVTTGMKTIGELSWVAMLVFFLFLAVLPLICHFSYVLGYKQISLSEKFIYVNSKKKKHRR